MYVALNVARPRSSRESFARRLSQISLSITRRVVNPYPNEYLTIHAEEEASPLKQQRVANQEYRRRRKETALYVSRFGVSPERHSAGRFDIKTARKSRLARPSRFDIGENKFVSGFFGGVFPRRSAIWCVTRARARLERKEKGEDERVKEIERERGREREIRGSNRYLLAFTAEKVAIRTERQASVAGVAAGRVAKNF